MACLRNPVIDGVMFIPDKAICFDRPSEAACASKWQHSLICGCSLRATERLLPPDTGCHYQIEGSEMDRPFSSVSMLDVINLGLRLWEWCVFPATRCKFGNWSGRLLQTSYSTGLWRWARTASADEDSDQAPGVRAHAGGYIDTSRDGPLDSTTH